MGKATITTAIGKVSRADALADGPNCPIMDAHTRHELIAQAAYFRAQHRGFAPGHEQEDWCVAAAEVDTALNPRPNG